jgi:hypothetical protein
MADWGDVIRCVKARFGEVKQAHADALNFRYELERNRQQRVWITRHVSQGNTREFLIIQSDIAYARQGGVQDMLKRADGYLIGGLVMHGETIAVRHALTLPQPDLDAFEQAVELIAKIADKLEEEYGTADVH